MKGLLWVLLMFVLAVGLALGVRLNEGYVLVVFPSWRGEISLNLFALALFLLFVTLYLAVRTISLTLSMPKRVREFRLRRQRERAGLVFQDAVRLLFEGRFGQALKKAGEAHAAGTAPGLSALIAARAAQRMREPEKQQGWMEHALRDDPRTEAATLMLEAEMMNEARRFDDALAALDKLQDKQGRHIAALRLELRARQGVADWPGVLKLVRQLAKRDALPVQVVGEIRTQAHLASIAACAADAGALTAYLRDLPDAERSPRVRLAAAQALANQGAVAEAQTMIEAALGGERGPAWQSELVVIYGHLAGGEQTARIAQAEAWLKQHPGDGDLLTALGRMCCRQRLWGKAQSYFEAALAVRENQETHLELARLCDLLERPEEANKHYRASARLAAR